ncbi:unnamed protein product [Diatraea saccharalis]|uniref:Uncharacterized protein n=1 Tax=Diatraea saccharalis TaxID=40085 RepID=A0A9N9WGQ9_9NEOP|nr:unnamed protein product [Diatraea saccharalis]
MCGFHVVRAVLTWNNDAFEFIPELTITGGSRRGGDPLKDFAGIRLLDWFTYKNPKRRVVDDQGVKKVKGSHPKLAIRKNYVPRGLKSVAVNSASYLNEDAKKIPVDEKFLYE